MTVPFNDDEDIISYVIMNQQIIFAHGYEQHEQDYSEQNLDDKKQSPNEPPSEQTTENSNSENDVKYSIQVVDNHNSADDTNDIQNNDDQVSMMTIVSSIAQALVITAATIRILHNYRHIETHHNSDTNQMAFNQQSRNRNFLRRFNSCAKMINFIYSNIP